MHQLQPLLEKIGLSHHESQIYLKLLQFGEMAASKVALGLTLPRSTVRGSLDKLCERGLITKLYKRNTQYYRCKPPEVLVELLERRIEQTHDIMQEVRQSVPLFDALYNKSDIMPKVQFYEGPKQVIEAFNRTLQINDLEEILVITSYEFLHHPVLRKNDEEVYIPVRLSKGIALRVVAGGNDLPEKQSLREPEMLRERRFLPKQLSFPGTFYIYGDAVLYFSASHEEYMAVNIESRSLAETMRALHGFMWETLSS